jgi:N-acetylglucosamine kinase-like BadF-type ATPase
MILVADSGSTKTDWIAADPGGPQQLFHTPGFNPFFHDYDFVTESLNANEGLKSIRNNITSVFFFGSGCSSPERMEQIRLPLSHFFTGADVSVEHDMLGCALSVCDGNPGIACILGTGSNTCYFDGKTLAPVRHGLGYVLGDEGSGSYFGKKLLSAYVYKILPPELHDAFYSKHPLTKEDIISSVYKKPAPNVWMASFAPFLSEHLDHPYIQTMIRKGFNDFFDTNVKSYRESENHPVHFTGSVAWSFKEILSEIAAENNIELGNVIRKPVNGLAEYFLNGGKMP